MKTHSKKHILARLEVGLRTDAARLIELEQALIPALQRGRGLGTEYDSPGDWNTAWGHHWDQVEIIMRQIHRLVADLLTAIQSRETDRHTQALQTWTTLQIENARFEQTIGMLHGQAIGLNATAQSEWDGIASTLATHLDLIHDCTEALRIKLVLLKTNTNEEVDAQVQQVLDRLSQLSHSHSGHTPDHAEEYHHAAVELQKEKNQFLGFIDLVKCMFMWTDSTQERTDKHLLQESF
jgi:hypothetical protein